MMQPAAPRAHRAGTTPSWLGKRNSSRSTSIAMDGRRNRYVRCVCVCVCVCVCGYGNAKCVLCRSPLRDVPPSRTRQLNIHPCWGPRTYDDVTAPPVCSPERSFSPLCWSCNSAGEICAVLYLITQAFESYMGIRGQLGSKSL